MKGRAMRLPAVFAAVSLAAAGCCTRYSLAPKHLKGLRYSGGGEVIEHYQVQNYGWYLFDTLPLVCGDTDPDATIPFSLFSDEVRTDTVTGIFNEHVRSMGAKPVSVAVLCDDRVTFEVPGLSIPLIIPYIICYREVQISALLVSDGQEGK